MWLIEPRESVKIFRTRHLPVYGIEIADSYTINLTARKEYRIGRGSVEGHDILLVEPLLFMNLSGLAVKKILRKFDIQPENLIIIHDDLDMETGKLRIRRTGSSGGHKGLNR
jgi:PTH1 family peptidyl-tRNA hydrolase